jgi:formyltetrahydrofolate deformylase
MGAHPTETATLLVTCPDQKGLVSKISTFLFQRGANILHADQHVDVESGLFLMRVEWEIRGTDLDHGQFSQAFRSLASELKIRWQIAFSKDKPRVAIFVSKFDHCLADLLYRHQIGELRCNIPLIISNHPQSHALADFYKIPYFYLAFDPERKADIEKHQLKLLQEYSIDLVVLARYMQILSGDFVGAYPNRIINIHHSFLPAFIGAKPYHQAYERGVKLIGATSHYVTEELDDGPIIHQDVTQISHRDQVEDLVRKGRDLEKVVLSKAVKWHLENRVVIYGKKTVIFD